MSTPQKRWGLSALSKDNMVNAYHEEVMVDKNTGEFLIKTPQGDIMSYNVIGRTKTYIDTVTNIAQSQNIYGKMYLVELSNPYPFVIPTTGLTLTIPDPITIDGTFSKIMISLDIDSLLIEDGKITKDRFNPNISMDFNAIDSSGTTVSSVIITDIPLTTFNTKVFTISNTTNMVAGEIVKLEIIMTGIDSTKIYRNILNSIIVVAE